MTFGCYQMMNELSSYNLLSHPDEYLINHLLDVANLSKKSILAKKLSFSNELNTLLPEIVNILGLCHDFGKSTANFQEYIRCDDPKEKQSLKSNPLTKHSLISAVFTYYCLKQYLQQQINNFDFLPYLGFLIVKRHHGNLDNPRSEFSSLDQQKITILKQQLKNIVSEELIAIYSKILPIVNLESFFNNFDNIIQEIKTGRSVLRNYLGKEYSFQFYLLFQLMYSTLLNADKMCASKLQNAVNDQCIEFSVDYVESYRRIMNWGVDSKDRMDKLRNEVYYEVMNKIPSIDLDDKIYSMNVPTGMGKTLTSFSFALKLREKIEQKYHYKPRIIYVLPFLSIIEQNFSVFEQVINKVSNKKPTTNQILKHHHLSEIFYDSEDEEFRDLEALLLMEGWNAEIIVTTFVQLFHTLISNKNHSLRKFHQIANSIIILDEIQSIDHNYWLLIKRLIEEVAKVFNTYFIFISATLPLIFDEKNNEITELADNKQRIFKEMDRVLLHYIPDVMTINDFAQVLRKEILAYPQKDFLIVLNTINSVKTLYKELKKHSNEKTKYYFLSTHITPYERLARINDIKDDTQRKVIISTQLIEAGVDIDIDIVYRDMAPLDSINQVAGRCNRNFGNEKQKVTIVNLKDNKKELCKYIYSALLIKNTREVLSDFGAVIPESSFLEMNNSYYRKIKESQSTDSAREVITLIEELQFDKFFKNFQLIKEDYEKKDIFVEINKEAKKIWKEYTEIITIKDFLERKKRFLKIKSEFYNYVISIPKSKVPDSIMLETKSLGYISQKELPYYYDLEIGFEPTEGGVLIF